MLSTNLSRYEVFRTIATTPYRGWPVYDATPLYDRSPFGGLEEQTPHRVSRRGAHRPPKLTISLSTDSSKPRQRRPATAQEYKGSNPV